MKSIALTSILCVCFSLDEAKPHPPVNVRVAKNTWSGVYFQYDIYWDRPEEGWAVTGYTVETLSMRDETAAQHCSCVDRHSEETNTMFAFQAGCSGSSLNRDHSLYYRVAANTKDSQSSFIAGEPVLVTTGSPHYTYVQSHFCILHWLDQW